MARARERGWWYPWIFVAAMLVVIAVNAVMITYAIGTFSGLDTEDAYSKGLTYNDTLAAEHAQEQRGWRADLRFSPGDARPDPAQLPRSELTVRLVDVSGQPLHGLVVSAWLVRPVKAGMDLRIPLDEQGDGIYGASFVLPAPGQWDARILARRGEEDFQVTRRVFVP